MKLRKSPESPEQVVAQNLSRLQKMSRKLSTKTSQEDLEAIWNLAQDTLEIYLDSLGTEEEVMFKAGPNDEEKPIQALRIDRNDETLRQILSYGRVVLKYSQHSFVYAEPGEVIETQDNTTFVANGGEVLLLEANGTRFNPYLHTDETGKLVQSRAAVDANYDNIDDAAGTLEVNRKRHALKAPRHIVMDMGWAPNYVTTAGGSLVLQDLIKPEDGKPSDELTNQRELAGIAQYTASTDQAVPRSEAITFMQAEHARKGIRGVLDRHNLGWLANLTDRTSGQVSSVVAAVA